MVDDEATANEVIDKLKAGAVFADLAKEYSGDEATREKGGKIDAWIKPGSFVPGIDQAENINRAIFAADAGTVLANGMASSHGVHVIQVLEKKELQQKGFAEVQQEVYSTLRSQKEEEVRQTLFVTLRNKYNVVIHMSQFQNEKNENGAGNNP